MSMRLYGQAKPTVVVSMVPAPSGVLQRKCACGSISGPTGECAACRRKRPSIQPKLTINQPGDKYEQEADRIADQVMRMPESQLQCQAAPKAEDKGDSFHSKSLERYPVDITEMRFGHNFSRIRVHRNKGEAIQFKSIVEQITPFVQRQIEPEEEQDEDLIQSKTMGSGISDVTPSINADIQSLRGGGRSLSEAELSFFEPRFGTDLSGVRVHSDTQAANIAQFINARAFTLGNDIVFNTGEYAPNTDEGRKLMAHELTHTIQQNGDPKKNMIQREEGQCAGTSTRNYFLRNSIPFEYTIPSGCRARSTFTAQWIYDGDCCTGRDTYEVRRNGNLLRPFPVGPNICGDSSENNRSRSHSIVVGSGRHRFQVNVDRRECDGIKMHLSVRTTIS